MLTPLYWLMMSIGAYKPPLPALLYLAPAYAVPGLVTSGQFAWIMGAVVLGLCSVVLWSLGRSVGLVWWLRLPIVAVFCLHPVTLSWAALGSPALLLVLCLLGLSHSLTGWRRSPNTRDLVAGAMYGAAAVLVAYESIFVVAAAAAYILYHCARGPRGSLSRAEGTLITFALPTVYVAGLWLVANWAIMGDPLHFWRVMLAGIEPVPVTPLDPWFSPLLIVLFTVQPLVLALTYHEIQRTSRRGEGVAIGWLAVAMFLTPFVMPTLRTTTASEALWAPLMPVTAVCVALGFALLMTVLAAHLRPAPQQAAEKNLLQRQPSRRLSAGFIFIAITSLVVAGGLIRDNLGPPAGWRSVWQGYPAFAHYSLDERKAGFLLGRELDPDRRNYIAGWPGFAIALYADAVGEVEVQADVAPPAAPLELEHGSWVVLLNGEDAARLWQERLPTHLHLTRRWTAGKWHGYEVTPPPPPDEPQRARQAGMTADGP